MTEGLSMNMDEILEDICTCAEPVERFSGRECFGCNKRILTRFEKLLIEEIVLLRDQLLDERIKQSK